VQERSGKERKLKSVSGLLAAAMGLPARECRR
jgi:hypothetical protein